MFGRAVNTSCLTYVIFLWLADSYIFFIIVDEYRRLYGNNTTTATSRKPPIYGEEEEEVSFPYFALNIVTCFYTDGG